MEKGSGVRFTREASKGPNRAHSSSAFRGLAPGRVLWPPTSIASAPSEAIASTRASAASGAAKRPPSWKESGVRFRIPTTRARPVRSQTPARWWNVSGSDAFGTGRRSGRGTSRSERTGSGDTGALARGDAGRTGATLGLLFDRLRRAALILAVIGTGRARERLQLFAAQHLLHLVAVQHLALEERQGQQVKLVRIVVQELTGVVVGAVHQAPHLFVDRDRGLLAVVALLRDLASEEHELLLGPERQGTQALAHAPLADHAAGDVGGAADVVRGAGRELVQHDLLRRATSHEVRQHPQPVLAGEGMALVIGQIGGETQGPATRDDRDLVNAVAPRLEMRHERVARLVVARALLFGVRDHEAPALGPHHD